jgi:hypothetical protein
MMEHEEVIDETLRCYEYEDLTEAERKMLKQRVDENNKARVPWFRQHAYHATHAEASKYLKQRVADAIKGYRYDSFRANPEEGWTSMPIADRRELLRSVDLWDGNTYAAREWRELPKRIQGDLIKAVDLTTP